MPLGYEQPGPGLALIPIAAAEGLLGVQTPKEFKVMRGHTGKTVRRPNKLKEAVTQKASSRREALKAASIAQGNAPLSPPNDLLPHLEVTYEPINSLKAPARMIRKLPPEVIEQVQNSIKALRASEPILLGRDNEIVDGVARLEAARKLGLKTFPCIRLTHLSPAEQELFRISKHQIGSNRPYDLPELKLAIEGLILEEQPIQVLGFSTAEIDTILQPANMDDVSEDAEEEGAETTPLVCRGDDLFQLGDHRLLCGDAKQFQSYAILMEKEQAQLGLTDPPYGIDVAKVVSTKHDDFIEGGGGTSQAEFEHLITSAFTHMRDHLVSGGMLLNYIDWRHLAAVIVIGKSLGLEHLNVITWVKSQGGMGSLWRSQSEFVVALKKKGTHKNNVKLGVWGRDRTNVWQVPGAGTRGTEASQMLKDHPTPKPVPMLVDAIIDVTDGGDIVLDPFGGSGSTLMAAEQTGRMARLIERDPKYCDLIIRRWQGATGKSAIHLASGESYDVLREQRLDGETDDEA